MQLALSFLQQHAPYLVVMVLAQVAVATAGHWATKDRGWDDTWIGACGLALVFGGPTVALWLAGLDARVPLAAEHETAAKSPQSVSGGSLLTDYDHNAIHTLHSLPSRDIIPSPQPRGRGK